MSGADGITPYAFYLLVFRGHTWLALILAGDIWERLMITDELIGLPHAPYCHALYLGALEEEWLKAGRGVKTDWQIFRQRVEAFGIEWEEKRFNVITGALGNPFQKDDALKLIKQGRRNDLMLMLNIHFLVFMKDKLAVPFVLSDLWWNMLMGGGLFGKEKDPEAFFYVSFDRLDKHISTFVDPIFRSNEVEMFGRVFGLKYAYYFLREVGLIPDPWYEKMTTQIQAIEFLFERYSKYHLWEMSFVFDWPEIVPFRKERKKVYEATFALNEDEYENELDDYFDACLKDFPRGLAAKLRS